MSMSSRPDTRSPNIVMFCTDHLRWDWLGCGGHPQVQSPQIDKLAAQGVSFDRSFSECPVCVPARRILMTGRDTYGIDMNENRDTQPFPEGPKLAELITQSGYQSFAAGKLHTWPQRNRIGFEDVQLNEEGRRQGGLLKDDYDQWLEDQGLGHRAYTHGLGNNQYGVRMSPLPQHATTTGWTRDRALEFLERRDPTRPFFLYVSFDKPHPPITPAPEFYELYRDVEFDSPAMGSWLSDKLPARIQHLRNANNWSDYVRRPRQIQETLRGYAAMITHIDSAVGTILGQLREIGELENTWILFTSDHGDQLFEHGNFAKGDFFRGSANIPLIVVPAAEWVSRHGQFQPGRVDRSHAAGLADVMPTLLDVAEVPDAIRPPDDTRAGQSLLPLLENEQAPFRDITYGNCTVVHGLSDGRYTYMWFGDDDMEFLFDRERDPLHCQDLASTSESKSSEELHRVLEHFRGALARRLADKNDPHSDPHAPNGRRAIPRDWNVRAGESVNLWNNRGRH